MNLWRAHLLWIFRAAFTSLAEALGGIAFEDVEYRSTEQRDGRADQPQRHSEIARELGAEAAGDNQHRQLRRHGVDRGRGQRKHRKLALLLPEIDKHRASRAYGRQAQREKPR